MAPLGIFYEHPFGVGDDNEVLVHIQASRLFGGEALYSQRTIVWVEHRRRQTEGGRTPLARLPVRAVCGCTVGQTRQPCRVQGGDDPPSVLSRYHAVLPSTSPVDSDPADPERKSGSTTCERKSTGSTSTDFA